MLNHFRELKYLNEFIGKMIRTPSPEAGTPPLKRGRVFCSSYQSKIFRILVEFIVCKASKCTARARQKRESN